MYLNKENGKYIITQTDNIEELYSEIIKEPESFNIYYKYIKEYINKNFDIEFRLFLDKDNSIKRIESKLFLIDIKKKINRIKCKIEENDLILLINVLEKLYINEDMNIEINKLKEFTLDEIYDIFYEEESENLVNLYNKYRKIMPYEFIRCIKCRSSVKFRNIIKRYILENEGGNDIFAEIKKESIVKIYNGNDLLYKYEYITNSSFNKYTYKDEKIILIENSSGESCNINYFGDHFVANYMNNYFDVYTDKVIINNKDILNKVGKKYIYEFNIDEENILINQITDINFYYRYIKILNLNIKMLNYILNDLEKELVILDEDYMLEYYYSNIERIIKRLIKEKKCTIKYYILDCEQNFFDKIQVFFEDLFVGNYQACRINFKEYKSLIKEFLFDNEKINKTDALKYLKNRQD